MHVNCPHCSREFVIDWDGWPFSDDPSYVESVFAFPLGDEKDNRNWRHMDEFKDIPSLINDNRIAEAEIKVEAALAKYPDYDCCYAWSAAIWKRKGKPDKARRVCQEGIKVCKARSTLCAELAEIEFHYGTLHEAVRSWIWSCLLQLHSGLVDESAVFPLPVTRGDADWK